MINYIPRIYGISQNPNTKNYIIIQDTYCSGNKKIDSFIQEMQLKISSCDDIVFEWIPYDQFYSIEKISEGDYATIYSAIWKDGPLHYNNNQREYTRKSNKRVTLKYLHDSPNSIDEFSKEV